MKRVVLILLLSALSFAFLQTTPLLGETGLEAWLRYARLDDRAARKYDRLVPRQNSVRPESRLVTMLPASI